MPHRVTLAAYNAAGELVKLIYEGSAQYLPGQLQIDVDRFIGGDGQVSIIFPGVLATGGNTVAWAGVNDSAMLVSGGVYTIKAEITDQWGQTTAMVRTVQVIPGGAQQTLRIYNSAGELVRSIPLTPVPGATRLELTSDSFALELDPSSGSAKQPFQVDVVGNNGSVTQSWDGLNSAGAPVASGSYSLQLVSNEGGRETVVTARSVTVLKIGEDQGALASALIGPNPVGAKERPTLFYDAAQLGGRRAEALVYNLNGELIGWAGDSAYSGRISLPLDFQRAGGIYLVRFQLRQGLAIVQSRVLKMAVLR
jgi:flagellar hook assembly protein FlgD